MVSLELRTQQDEYRGAKTACGSLSEMQGTAQADNFTDCCQLD